MARIKATGYLLGRRRVVEWRDGELSGDEPTIETLKIEARRREGEYIGPPTGGGRSTDHLSWPGGFSEIVRGLLLGARFEASGLPEPELEGDDDPETVVY